MAQRNRLLSAFAAPFRRLVGRAAPAAPVAEESRSATATLNAPSITLIDALGGTSASGAKVNETTAATVSGVNACVSVLADMIGALPVKLYVKTAAGREELPDHPASRVISVQPGEHTPFEVRQLAQTGVGFGGNGYLRVHRDGYYQPAELEWLKPADVEVGRTKDRVRVFKVNGVRDLLTRADVIHVRGLSQDGLVGLSPIRQLRESIGLSLTQREQAGKIYANGARFPGFLVSPASLSKEQADDIRTEWQKKYAGVSNVGTTPILHGGLDYKVANGMTMADAEFLESRRFELEEICRLYRVPPFMVGATDKTSSWGTGIEQMTLGFLQFCFNPWLVNWEQSLGATLLTADEQAKGYYFKFNRAALLQAGLEAQAKFFREMRDIGVYSVNDVRRRIEENDLPDNIGDNYQLAFNGSGGRPADAAAPASTGAAQ